MIDMGTNPLPFILNVIILILVFALPLMTLLLLFRSKNIPDLVRVLWVLVILGFPIGGPVAFVLSRLIRSGIDQAASGGPGSNKEPNAG